VTGCSELTSLADEFRPSVRGKFLFAGDEKLWLKGVSYGPFRPTPEGCEYHDPGRVAADFSLMARNGINAVRTYTVPPRWLLDLAKENGLRVMVGLPWEQHVAFLDGRKTAANIERRVREGVHACVGHPAIMAYAVGNEIPSPIARWYGRRPIERFVQRLYQICKEEDGSALVTYANYPSTEYLDLSFLDFTSFNVYLETQQKLQAYLARLQNIAMERPLIVTEIGLDGGVHGADEQARSLESQIRTVFASGCGGAFVFSWTDEWFRGGQEVKGWEFGVTTRAREPKPALSALNTAFADAPLAKQTDWPKISVVVCTHNGSHTLAECLQGLQCLDYPNYETIVVDDGSTDDVALIARSFSSVRLIQTENRGLSRARNTGMEAATGEIIAYIDDDAWPDPQWLKYLATLLIDTQHAGVGGPNLAPPGDGFRAECVAHAPGGPNHVLITDTLAEHVPGCNMAFRKSALQAIGGFDAQFRIAGDDVDLCWRLQKQGMTIGFSPAAIVWHHRRSRFRAYWKQQLNYGRAEAMLESKWPEKYNAMGNPTWCGRLYSKGVLQVLGWKGARIYHGTWGSALFQSVYHVAPGVLHALPTTPEWYLIIAVLAAIGAAGLAWVPLLVVLPFLLAAIGITFMQAIIAAIGAYPSSRYPNRLQKWNLRAATAWLHLIQPAARLAGRLTAGLTPWRRRGAGSWVLPRPRVLLLWSQDQWRSNEQRLKDLEAFLCDHDSVVLRGGDFDDWDLEIRGGVMGAVRLRMAVEEHGDGKQLVRVRAWPRCSHNFTKLLILLTAICSVAMFVRAWETWLTTAVSGLITLGMLTREIGGAMAAVVHATRGWKRGRK
jgi:GT2 family glycosyltransferase